MRARLPGKSHGGRGIPCWLVALLLCACGDTRALQLGLHDPTVSPPSDGGSGGQSAGTGGDVGSGGQSVGTGGDVGSGGQDAIVCTPPMADCDGLPDNGCEADLGSSVEHCGACGAACTTPGCACVDGAPVLQCAAGLADCDGVADNGCEQDTDASTNHCGGCGLRCPSFGFEFHRSQCVAGTCVPVCEASHADCDDDISNGCESSGPC